MSNERIQNMKVRGAYISIEDFLYTYKQGVVHTENGQNPWYLEANRSIIIPGYQREYRWEEKQLTELIQDVTDGNCYLGQIAVSHNADFPSNYYLVDGQQRITSIIILLTILYRQFYLETDTVNLNRYELHSNNYNVSCPSQSRLTFKANSFNDFQTFVAQIYDLQTDENFNFIFEDFQAPSLDSYHQTSRYIDACSVCNREIIRRMNLIGYRSQQLEFVRKTIDNILNTQISVVVFESKSLYEGEKIFLDVNEKGLRLDNEDILKAYYFKSVSTDNGTEALETWQKLKENYFNLQSELKSSKIPLETYTNYALQTELVTKDPVNFHYSDFDNNLRYKAQNGKLHICQFLSNTALDEAIKHVADFFHTSTLLLQNSPTSIFYSTYLPGRDSTTKEIYHMLFKSLCYSDMKLVFIALIKFWWFRKKHNENLSYNDVIQLFSFYIICNISGAKKEKTLFNNDFIGAKSEQDLYLNLHLLELQMLQNASSKATTLKNDQERAEYLSFNIQMFYNDFHFNKNKSIWEIKIRNQDFLEKYSPNRRQYSKDHFLIQNGSTITLYGNDEQFLITPKLKNLRKRTYNFIYHKDTFGNLDFVSRLNHIYEHKPDKPNNNLNYGKYENDYFHFIENSLMSFFKINNTSTIDKAWESVLEEYSKNLSNNFPDIISYILEEQIFSWNQKVCKHFYSQFPQKLIDQIESS